METPLHVQQGQVITGELRLAAHNRQSYDVFVTLTAPPLHPGQPPQQVHLPAMYPFTGGCLVHTLKPCHHSLADMHLSRVGTVACVAHTAIQSGCVVNGNASKQGAGLQNMSAS